VDGTRRYKSDPRRFRFATKSQLPATMRGDDFDTLITKRNTKDDNDDNDDDDNCSPSPLQENTQHAQGNNGLTDFTSLQSFYSFETSAIGPSLVVSSSSVLESLSE
jgi:hypothetical protein